MKRMLIPKDTDSFIEFVGEYESLRAVVIITFAITTESKVEQ